MLKILQKRGGGTMRVKGNMHKLMSRVKYMSVLHVGQTEVNLPAKLENKVITCSTKESCSD